MQPAMLDLQFNITGTHYIDLAAALSYCNRRSYEQGRNYFVSGISFVFEPGVNVVNAEFKIQTAGNTWVVHNAWTKGKAAWDGQQRDARRITGASAKPTWEDYKVFLDDHHRAAQAAPYAVLDGDFGPVNPGEWVSSKLVYITDADAAAQEWFVHLVGPNVSTTDKGLVLGYQQSRVTVQDDDPELPAEASTNMYALLQTDDNLSSDEVMQNMEDENDSPPYDLDDYPGNDSNAEMPWMTRHVKVNAVQSNGFIPGFLAQCGLVLVKYSAEDAAGDATGATACRMIFHMSPGSYKGVQAEAMGQ